MLTMACLVKEPTVCVCLCVCVCVCVCVCLCVCYERLFTTDLSHFIQAPHMWASALQHADLKQPLCEWAYIKSFLFATMGLNILYLLINADKHHQPVNMIDSFTRVFRSSLYLLGLCLSSICLYPSVPSGKEMNRQTDTVWTRLFVKDHIYPCFHTAAPQNPIRCSTRKTITENTLQHSLSASLSTGKKNHKWDLVKYLDCLSCSGIKLANKDFT